MDATLYRTDGTQEAIKPRNGKDFKLAELRDLLGCSYIEVIQTGDPSMIFIGDEESRCRDEYTINTEATRVYREGHGIKDPVAFMAEQAKAMKAMYGDMLINMAENEPDPYALAGNIIYCPSVMLQ